MCNKPIQSPHPHQLLYLAHAQHLCFLPSLPRDTHQAASGSLYTLSPTQLFRLASPRCAWLAQPEPHPLLPGKTSQALPTLPGSASHPHPALSRWPCVAWRAPASGRRVLVSRTLAESLHVPVPITPTRKNAGTLKQGLEVLKGPGQAAVG